MTAAYARTFVKTVLATLCFGVMHSLLASRAAKQTAAELFGQRQRNAFYRLFYLAQSFITFGVLLVYLLRLPDKTLYRARGLFAGMMRMGQFGSLLYAVYAAHQVGIPDILGLSSFVALLTGRAHVPAEPEAQGPRPSSDGGMKASGPFRRSRHPLNFVPVPIFWLNPRMTVRLLAFNLAATLYLMLGSLHEERRLLRAYGDDYAAYRASDINFYWPRIG